jgi:hypothetical protein
VRHISFGAISSIPENGFSLSDFIDDGDASRAVVSVAGERGVFYRDADGRVMELEKSDGKFGGSKKGVWRILVAVVLLFALLAWRWRVKIINRSKSVIIL